MPGQYGLGDLRSLLPATDSVVTPADVLNYRQLGYTYDTTN
jgi:tyrosinase